MYREAVPVDLTAKQLSQILSAINSYGQIGEFDSNGERVLRMDIQRCGGKVHVGFMSSDRGTRGAPRRDNLCASRMTRARLVVLGALSLLDPTLTWVGSSGSG
ncbi:unnamed protein product [Pylaiella littoralis]